MKDAKVSPFLLQECNSRIFILYQKPLLNDKDGTGETSHSNPLLLLKVNPDKRFTVVADSGLHVSLCNVSITIVVSK